MAAVLLAVSLITPAGAALAAAAQPPDDYRLVWSDEFTKLNLGDRRGAWFPYWRTWNVRHLTGNNDQAAKYADDEMLEGGITAGAMLEREGRWGDAPYLHEVSAGTLKLRAYPLSSAGRAKTSGFPFIASMISGERQPAQNHGYWETRLRINRLGDGLHLAVWLLNDKNEWPPEIDILEVVGLHPAKFTANSHLKGGGAPYISSYAAPNGAKGWHVLGFEWTEERMRWTVNGQVVREHESFYGDDRLYFLVSWEVGGNWAGMPTGNTPWPGEVEIDYVRLYEKKPAGPAQPAQSAPKPPAVTAGQEPTPETAVEPEQAAAAPPAQTTKPEPAASQEPVIETAETTPPEPAKQPAKTAEPAPTPAPEQTPRQEPVIETAETTGPEPAATPVQTAEPEPATEPEQPVTQSATVAPAVLPQRSLAWRFGMLRRMSTPTPETSQQSSQPGSQPAPIINSLGDWQAMRDRTWLFRFAQ